MKKFSKLNEVRLKDITPEGWLKRVLLSELDGMPGNLHKIGYPYDRECWKFKSLADGGYAAWWPYEQDAYRVDSVTRASALADDLESFQRILGAEVSESLNGTDTFIGPEELKKNESRNRWPHAVYFRALYALWSKTGDEFYLEKMRAHYLNDSNDYSDSRDVVNVETMFRLYEHFGDEALLEKAKKAYDTYCLSNGIESVENLIGNTPIHDHGVSFNEIGKIAAIMYIYTGERRYIDSAVAAYKRVDDFHMLADGVHSSSEALCGKESFRTHESCDISDFTWSLGYLLEATGDGKYADKIEKAIFNAFFGATGMNFKAIQYLSCVNQVICARNSTHIKAWRDTPRMAFAPHHYPECCVGNIGRAFPNYVLRMYQKTDDGIAVSLYGDSRYEDDNVEIVQSGGYPYGMKIKFAVNLKKSGSLQLKIRIPSWTAGAQLFVNSEPVEHETVNGYAAVSLSKSSAVELKLNPTFTPHPSVDGGVYFEYGPFLLALKIDEKREIDEKEKRQTKAFPAYNIYPASKWNYAVSGWEEPQIILHEARAESMWEYIPFEIKIKARVLKNWELVSIPQEKKENGGEGIDNKQIECGATVISEDNLLTPDIPSQEFIKKNLGEEEEITLIPYGCTNIRLTVFPKYIKYM